VCWLAVSVSRTEKENYAGSKTLPASIKAKETRIGPKCREYPPPKYLLYKEPMIELACCFNKYLLYKEPVSELACCFNKYLLHIEPVSELACCFNKYLLHIEPVSELADSITQRLFCRG